MTYLLLKSLHVLFMAFWLAAIIKELCTPLSFTEGQAWDKEQSLRLEKQAGTLGTVSGMGTILSGGLLLYIVGFFSAPWPIYAGLLITLVMAFMGAFGVGGSFHKIIKAIDNSSNINELEILLSHLKRWSFVMLILWLTVFSLMSLRHML